jgi:hypothetical protein
MTPDELVTATLFNQIQQDASEKSCFSANRAGLNLLASTEEVLPSIERALLTVVEPTTMSGGSIRAFEGLDYVLGAYLVIGSKFSPARMIGFLEARSVAIQAEAIACIPVFFWIVEGRYNFGTSPAKELLEYLDRARASTHGHLRSTAQRVSAILGDSSRS